MFQQPHPRNQTGDVLIGQRTDRQEVKHILYELQEMKSETLIHYDARIEKKKKNEKLERQW